MKYEIDSYSTRLAEILNKLYTDKDFYEEIVNIWKGIDILNIRMTLASILEYYIESKDEEIYANYETTENTIKAFRHSYNEFGLNEEKYKIYNMDISNEEKKRRIETIASVFKSKRDEVCENIVDGGYISHSFYGKEGEYIKKYGLNYVKYLSRTEQVEYYTAKKALIWLINFFYKTSLKKENGSKISLYNSNNKKMEIEIPKLFFTTPGDTTFLYTVAHTPAILYEGPLRNYNKELKDLQNTTKEEVIKQILQRRVSLISQKRRNEEGKTDEQKRRINILEKRARVCIDLVVDFYCSGLPGFALVRISDIKKAGVKFGLADIEKDSDIQYSFEDLIEERKKQLIKKGKLEENINLQKFYMMYFFSDDFDIPTSSRLEDFCARSEDLDRIPAYCVSCLDEFDIVQLMQNLRAVDPR